MWMDGSSLLVEVTLIGMAKRCKVRGTCSQCGEHCFIECAKCFAMLLEKGQEHNCPEGGDEVIELCDRCCDDTDMSMV